MNLGSDINFAAQQLIAGKTVAIPTETVYGLAANAFDVDAVIQIFEIKQRPKFNPLIVHVGSWEMVALISTAIPSTLKLLADTFWPGPLTLLLPKSSLIHDIVTAGSEMVAVRMPNHPLTLQLLQTLTFPLAAPSANLFGTISPTSAQHVSDQLGDKLAYILDGGQSEIGVESTIVKVNNDDKVVILRPGGITAEAIADLIGYKPEIAIPSEQPEAPGMLKSHYAPKIPLIIGDIDHLINECESGNIAVLSYNKLYNDSRIVMQRRLSPNGNLHEAAQQLFSALHDLEQSEAAYIIGEFVPNNGIGIAINDRLTRASS